MTPNLYTKSWKDYKKMLGVFVNVDELQPKYRFLLWVGYITDKLKYKLGR